MENKNITSYILQHLQKENAEHITISDDSFVVQLSEYQSNGFWKRGARLVGLILTCVVVLAFIIYTAVFYCQNVLFYRGELNVNQFGAFTPKKSYSSEYAMYLFDSKEQWISSGIQVLEGDRLFISASGAYHTNYKKLVETTRNNTNANAFWIDTIPTKENSIDTVCLRWIYPTHPNHSVQLFEYKGKENKLDTINPDTINRKYIGSYTENGQPFSFGDILLQVVPEYQISNALFDDTARIYKIPEPSTKRIRKPITIRQNGVLAFMVNDKKPENNIGQILVVTEIFRHSDSFGGTTLKEILYRWLDLPYYYYELLKHENSPGAAIVYWVLACMELAIFCVVAFYFPIVIYYLCYFILHPKKEFLRLKARISNLCLRMKPWLFRDQRRML